MNRKDVLEGFGLGISQQSIASLRMPPSLDEARASSEVLCPSHSVENFTDTTLPLIVRTRAVALSSRL